MKSTGGINVADPFYKSFYFELLQEIFVVLTDSFHKSGFQLQVEILHSLIYVVEVNIVSESLFNQNISNKDSVLSYIITMNTNAFTHINKIQIETFALALFNKVYSLNDFKDVVRDFLINLKSFSGDDEELFLQEKKVQLMEAKTLDEKKRGFVPGLAPMYNEEIRRMVDANNYKTFED